VDRGEGREKEKKDAKDRGEMRLGDGGWRLETEEWRKKRGDWRVEKG